VEKRRAFHQRSSPNLGGFFAQRRHLPDGACPGLSLERLVVLAEHTRPDEGTSEVLVLAITHTPSAAPEDAVPIPRDVKQRIGLDDAPSWIVTTEANAFIWPGPDIRPVPGRPPRTVVYGRIPDGLLRQVARSFLENRDRQRSRRVVPTQ
jgi:hypothetical protein